MLLLDFPKTWRCQTAEPRSDLLTCGRCRPSVTSQRVIFPELDEPYPQGWNFPGSSLTGLTRGCSLLTWILHFPLKSEVWRSSFHTSSHILTHSSGIFHHGWFSGGDSALWALNLRFGGPSVCILHVLPVSAWLLSDGAAASSHSPDTQTLKY